MLDQFSRTKLLIGNENLEKLKNSKIIIFGLGGVGGYTTEALARSGIGTIDIVDNDTISTTNLNRQIIALHSTIGQYKVDVAKQRILDINPNSKVQEYKVFYDDKTSLQFDFSKYDYIIDAIDSTKSKIELVINAKKTNTKIISSMGTGNKLNPFMFEITDISKTTTCPLARTMRQELKKRNIKTLKVLYSKEPPTKPQESLMQEIIKQENLKKSTIPSSAPFIPPIAGLIIASEVVKDLITINNKI